MHRAADPGKLEGLEGFSHMERIARARDTSHKEKLFQPFQTGFLWRLTVDALLGCPGPALPEIPGRIVRAADTPITDADLIGATVEEARRCLGGTLERAARRMAEINNAPSGASTKDEL
ncbi:MAG: hypothetical protein KGL43_06685 [Burkholderiales bacterium]|nr:hypothetical protein [Burkholderiales bacterium]